MPYADNDDSVCLEPVAQNIGTGAERQIKFPTFAVIAHWPPDFRHIQKVVGTFSNQCHGALCGNRVFVHEEFEQSPDILPRLGQPAKPHSAASALLRAVSASVLRWVRIS